MKPVARTVISLRVHRLWTHDNCTLVFSTSQVRKRDRRLARHTAAPRLLRRQYGRRPAREERQRVDGRVLRRHIRTHFVQGLVLRAAIASATPESWQDTSEERQPPRAPAHIPQLLPSPRGFSSACKYGRLRDPKFWWRTLWWRPCSGTWRYVVRRTNTSVTGELTASFFRT